MNDKTDNKLSLGAGLIILVFGIYHDNLKKSTCWALFAYYHCV